MAEQLLKALLDYDSPKPKNNSPQKCIVCNELTTEWYTEYPKHNSIIYRHHKCKPVSEPIDDIDQIIQESHK